MLEADRRRHVEHRDEQPRQREGDDQRTTDDGEGEHDRRADGIRDEDRGTELALRHPARQDRVRRIQRPDVALGVDSTGRVEVVVDHVIGGMGQHEPDDGEEEQAPVDRRPTADPVRFDREQTAEQPRPDGHREDRSARDDQPLADRVEWPGHWRIRRLEDLLPSEESLADRQVGDGGDGVHGILGEHWKRARQMYHVPRRITGGMMPR
jgi:hypothetical protein